MVISKLHLVKQEHLNGESESDSKKSIPLIIITDDKTLDESILNNPELEILLKETGKNIDEDDFRKLKKRVVEPEIDSNVKDQHISETTYLTRLLVKDGDKMIFIDLDDVDWFEASGNYVKIFAGEKKHIIRSSLKNMESRLNPNRFVRIHKSTIVNVDRIKLFERWFTGDYNVKLKDGRDLKMSRTYRNNLDRFKID